MEELRIPLEGLDRDVQDLQRKEGAYTFALNAVSSSKGGHALSLQNEMGNILCYDFDAFQIIGKRYISEYNKHILFLTNGQTSRIGLFSFGKVTEADYSTTEYCEGCQKTDYSHSPKAECKFELLVEAACLGFSAKFPVTCRYKITNNTFQIYFRDSNNENRYLYFDIKDEGLFLQNKFKLGYRNDCDGEQFSDQLNCGYAAWYQKYTSPTITTSFENGGSLEEGTYQVMFAWSTSKGVAVSSYSSLTNPLPLFGDVVKTETNRQTSKGLRIRIEDNSDVIHQFYNLVILQTINNFTSYKLVTLPKDQKEYFFTDATTLIRVDENEVFRKYPFYKNSDYLTEANGFLIQAGMHEFDKLNIQRIANRVELKWQTVELKEGDYADPIISQNYRSYLRDELYAFGLVFVYSNGEETPVAHIPGRIARTGERELVSDPTNTNPNDANKLVEKWRLYNTATITASPRNPYNKENPQTYEEGDFAFWESTDRYPNNREIWGDLCGQPIRFHKFPDSGITHHHSGKDFLIPNDYITLIDIPTTYIYPLGIKVVSDISTLLDTALTDGIINQDQRDRIVGYKIVRANRFGNRSVITKGWVYNTREYEKNSVKYRFPNYPYNDLRPDRFISRSDKRDDSPFPGSGNLRIEAVVADNKPFYTFHSPNTHFANPSLGNVLKIETESYGFSRGKFVECQNEAEHKILSQRHYNFAIIIASVLARSYDPTNENLAGSAATIGQGAGSAIGAIAGSVIPGVGTAIGAALGGMLGGLIGNAFEKDNDKLKAGPRAIMWLAQTEKILQLISLSTPFWQYHYQYQATGKYFAYKTRPNDSNKLYKLQNWKYLQPETTSLPTTQGSLQFNNWQRESSVFIETDRTIPNPSIQDVSRNDRIGLFGGSGENLKYMISSQYVSIKNEIRNQYGTVFNLRYLSTNGKVFKLNEKPSVFGGDTFINAFSIKRKHRFFNSSTYGFGNGSDIYYEDLGNAGFPVYWFNTRNVDVPPLNLLEGLTFLPGLGSTIKSVENSLLVARSIIGMSGTKDTVPKLAYVISFGLVSLFRKKENIGDKLVGEFMEDIADFFQAELLSPEKYFKPPRYYFDGEFIDPDDQLSTNGVRGRIYLYSFGISTYICESDINIDLRHAEDTKARDFYPNQANLDYWLQEKNVPFAEDNYFFYNKTYSKQPLEQSFVVNDINFKPYDKTQNNYPNRVIYSLQDGEVEDSNLRDNWLVNRALDFKDFSFSKGFLKGIDQLENAKVLVRFENGTRMFAAYNQIQTDQDTLQIGNGGIFASKPITFAETDYGYYGSQHRAFLSTEYGHVSVDAKRGNIFILGPNGEVTDEITRYGLRSWFNENLPFQIPEYFKVNVDNAYLGIGIDMVYDKDLKRLLITKLDYRPKRKGIIFNGTNFLFEGRKIELTNPAYFYNLSWTISYDFELKKFRSWHSYTPNLYLGGVNEFFTNQGNEVWVHNQSNKLYQQFYGKQVPFVIDGFTKPNIQKTMLKSVSFSTDSIQYLDEYNERFTNITFEEAVVYNKNQHSGILKLEQIGKNDLTNRVKYPINNPEHVQVLLDKSDDEYSFNQFNDKSANNVPFWLYDSVQVNKKINPESVGYFKNELSCDKLKAQMHFVRLSNQTNSTNNIIIKYIKLNHNGGLRS